VKAPQGPQYDAAYYALRDQVANDTQRQIMSEADLLRSIDRRLEVANRLLERLLSTAERIADRQTMG
jgi:hypothetical protein